MIHCFNGAVFGFSPVQKSAPWNYLWIYFYHAPLHNHWQVKLAPKWMPTWDSVSLVILSFLHSCLDWVTYIWVNFTAVILVFISICLVFCIGTPHISISTRLLLIWISFSSWEHWDLEGWSGNTRLRLLNKLISSLRQSPPHTSMLPPPTVVWYW